MALKPTITATEYATLNDVIKAEYKLGLDGSYKLDLGGFYVTDKDPAGLFSALENEREEHKKTKGHLNRLESERDEAKKQAELAAAQKSGDIEALKKLFEEQKEEIKRQFQEQVEAERARVVEQQKNAAEQFRKAEAEKLATELFGAKAPIMLPHILSQMQVTPGDTPKLEYLNSEGKPDLTATGESFKKSFLTNPLFADMIVASKASGGSASGETRVSTKADGTPKGFHDYSPGELLEIKKADPSEFQRLLDTCANNA